MAILVRPVREQLEHDRVIRQLQQRLRRRHEVAVNIGEERAIVLKVGATMLYPDLVVTSADRGRRLAAVVEVETGESVNHLEALAQWTHMARSRAPLQLYVPAASVETTRRLCAEHQIPVAEIWSYHFVGDQTRFTLVHRLKAAAARARRAKPARPAAGRKAAGPRARATRAAGTRARAAARPKTAVRKPAARAKAKTSSRKGK